MCRGRKPELLRPVWLICREQRHLRDHLEGPVCNLFDHINDLLVMYYEKIEYPFSGVLIRRWGTLCKQTVVASIINDHLQTVAQYWSVPDWTRLHIFLIHVLTKCVENMRLDTNSHVFTPTLQKINQLECFVFQKNNQCFQKQALKAK